MGFYKGVKQMEKTKITEEKIKMLKVLYDWYVNNKKLDNKKLIKKFNYLTPNQYFSVIELLIEEQYIICHFLRGEYKGYSIIIFDRILPKGIDEIEKLKTNKERRHKVI